MRRRKTPGWLRAARHADAPRHGGVDWLARALSRAGVLSPADVPAALRAGRVRVDGRVAREPFTVCPPGSRIELDGRPVDLSPRTLVLAFHKPPGLVVSSRDAQGVGTVFEALSAQLPKELASYRWLAVGRLDRDTTGLLLFTNDERLVAHATAPATHLPKRYLVTVGGSVLSDTLVRLRQGIQLHHYQTRPALVHQRAPSHIELTLTEGKFHQVKQMMNAVGLATLALHREAVGSLELDVPVGHCRLLTDAEVLQRLGYRPRHDGPPTSEPHPRSPLRRTPPTARRK